MDSESFDAIIAGAGQAGPAIAARCSREGLKTAVIERHHVGGTCVNVACVPTKTLVASARAIRQAQRGAEFGFDVGGLRVDMARVKARKDAIVRTSREGVETWMRGLKSRPYAEVHPSLLCGAPDSPRIRAEPNKEPDGRRPRAARQPRTMTASVGHREPASRNALPPR